MFNKILSGSRYDTVYTKDPSQVNGTCGTYEEQLVLANKDGKYSIVALVFNEVMIPRNSKIVSATVKLTSKTNTPGHVGYVDIYGRINEYDLTGIDTCNFKDLSSLASLTAAESWNVTASHADGTLTTVDLKNIIQQRISHEYYSPCQGEGFSQCYVVLFLKPLQEFSEVTVYSVDHGDISKRPSVSVDYKLPCK